METQHVFLDTEVFDHNNLNFGSASLLKLIELAQQGIVVVHLTTVTVREIEAHIVSNVTEVISSLRKFYERQRSVKFVSSLPGSPFQPIPRDYDPEPLKQSGLTLFEQFRKDARINTIPVNDVPIDGVFHDYFAATPPFGAGKNKSEFPDAFVLAALHRWCEETENRIYVVSNDGGMLSACDGSPTLIPLSSLDEFLDLSARGEKDLYEYATSVYENFRNEILELLKERFVEIGFYLDQPDSDVFDIEVTEVDITKELATSIAEDAAVFEIIADVEFTGDYSYADFIVEDVVISKDEGTFEYSSTIHAKVRLLYDHEDPEVSQVEDLWIEETGIMVDLEPKWHELK